MDDIIIDGKVVEGRGIASGRAYGSAEFSSIAKQKPFFAAAGMGRALLWFDGTINVETLPKKFKVIKPDYEVTAEWNPATTETFWLIDVRIEYKGESYPATLYYPLESAIKIQSDTIMEILAEKIEGVAYGDAIRVLLPAEKFEISE